MKKFLLLAFSLLSWGVYSQNKNQKFFTLPAGSDYVRGHVMVKVKDGYKSELTEIALRKTQTTIKNSSIQSIKSILKGEPYRNARLGKQAVDISKYFLIEVDPNENIEATINNLYATGYFEIVEPEYISTIDLTPNDPKIAQQYYLNTIKAIQAWDITQGDTSVVIAIVDTGGNLTHEDLAPNLFRNWAEYPPNGADDDGNGLIDDYQGWDFMGSDTLNAVKSDFVGDNDPSINHIPALSNVEDLSHGTWVGGCASATANNSKGIAGVGYNTRLMFVKHTADNQRTNSPGLYGTILGIAYAGDLFYRHNIKGIINCSFGGSGKSQIVQDLINHVVLDQNCLVVAAGGNSNSRAPSYPGGYDNVLSVAATDINDVRASFSNYGTTIDLAAPGVGIFSTQYNNTYGTVDGTSFSSPITAGAAALVWAKNPNFTASQVGEQVRVSADADALYSANPNLVHQLGIGRLDISRALTLNLPSIRASNLKLVNKNGFSPLPGDQAYLTFDFTNYLKSTSGGIQIAVSSKSAAIAITKGTITPGIIAEGSTLSNSLTPFELKINPTTVENAPVDLIITYSDGVYSDFQVMSFYVNPSYIDVNSNQINTTVTSIGRIGYLDIESAPTKGSGFIFNNNQMLFEMGLIMGTSAGYVLSNTRGALVNKIQTFNNDFISTVSIKQIAPGVRSYSEIYGEFSGRMNTDYRSLVWKDSPYDKFVILEYQLSNISSEDINNFYFGIFSDWDISASGSNDAANWDATRNLGYVYPAQQSAKPYGGIQVLTGSPAYYAIDNDNTISGNPFGIYDGFTNTEKFTAISAAIGSGRERLQAGVGTADGNDVSHVVSSGPFNIPAGKTITVAFALHAAANLTDIQKSASYADSLYNYTLKATKPAGDSTAVCYNSPATLNASGATTIKWYNTFTGGQSFHTGNSYTSGNLTNDTTFYVSNADQNYESVRTAVKATVKANPKIITSGSTIMCAGDSLKLFVATADSTIWSNGEKTNIIEAKTAGSYSVRVKDVTLNCSSQSDTVSIVVNPKPTADFSVTGILKTDTLISFTDHSTDATNWFWNFDDGHNSSDQNPTHNYEVMKNYAVTLTVTAANGCTDTKLSTIAVVTGIEETATENVTIYPNPVHDQPLQLIIESDEARNAQIDFTNSVGQTVLSQGASVAGRTQLAIPVSGLTPGLYIIRVNLGGKTFVRKLIKAF